MSCTCIEYSLNEHCKAHKHKCWCHPLQRGPTTCKSKTHQCACPCPCKSLVHHCCCKQEYHGDEMWKCRSSTHECLCRTGGKIPCKVHIKQQGIQAEKKQERSGWKL